MTSGNFRTQFNGGNSMEIANSNQELLARHRRTRITAIIIGIIIILAVVGTLIWFFLFRQQRHPQSLSHSITLESFLQGGLSPKRFNGSWVSDSEILYKTETGSIVLFDVATNKTQELVSNDNPILKSSFLYDLSSDKKFLLLAHNYQKIYRHTFTAQYEVFDIESKISFPLSNSNPMQLQLVVWAPVGNALAYISLNDIFYRPEAKNTSEYDIRITNTGRPGTIYNGLPDWVYEEEVFSSNKALWFSPDGSKIAFATFNDSLTPVMSIPYYGMPGDPSAQYVQTVNIRYPKPGRPNPVVSLSVRDLKGNIRRELTPPPQLINQEPILAVVAWASASDVVAIWMNRVQNEAYIIMCSSEGNTTCRQVYEKKERNGWVDLFEPPIFSSDGKRFIVLQPHDQKGSEGAFNHVTLIDTEANNRVVPLTQGKYTVTEILAWNEKNHFIYFLSNDVDHPSWLQLNRVPDNPIKAPHKPDCISCDYKHTKDGDCLYNGASYSRNNTYYIDTCAGPILPQVRLRKMDGSLIADWETNNNLRAQLKNKTLPIIKQLTVPLPNNLTACVKLFMSPDLDVSGDTTYPLLINVYGGPGSVQVTERFSIDWNSYLTVNRSIIYAVIDGRGSDLKGTNTLFANYRRLGTHEIEDQIAVTKYLQDTFHYIDKKRTGIWGWSYGGYATGMVLANDTSGVFKCGISVAPVSDWLLYDTIYTERYMGLPTMEDNMEGYVAAALNNKVANIKNKLYYLVHGTLDDNVHYQQSMMLSKALEFEDILFQQQTYPDEEHGLSGVRNHLYHSLEHFLNECFALS